MKLKFNSRYKSISGFDDFELGKLTILTGLNGAGKSHFLEGIKNGNIQIEGVNKEHINYFNYTNFLLNNEGQFDGRQIKNEKIQIWNHFNSQIKPTILSYKNTLGESYNLIKELCIENKENILDLNADLFEDNAIFQLYETYRNNIFNFFHNNNHKTNYMSQSIFGLFNKLSFNIDEIDETIFKNKLKIVQLKDNFLPTNLGKIISDYYFSYEENTYSEWRKLSKKDKVDVLSDKQFYELNGDKPWKIINEILDKFSSLKYKINSPEGLRRDDFYKMKLLKDGVSDNIEFSDLSSGEKTLMALVASIYKKESDNFYPKVLLLDEIDSSLHPSMIRNLLEVIENIFIKKGVKVILVTHSPSTIALAPSDSIRLLKNEGTSLISKISKEEAISILTEGFLIVKEHEKNVLVEGVRDDEKFYKDIFLNLDENGFLENKNIGINFISAGTGGASGSGSCTKIINIISELSRLGLNDLLGIIDNDNTERGELEKVFMGNRYSYENYLFDPIFIFALLVNEGFNETDFNILLGEFLITKMNYQKINNLTVTQLNKIIIYVCKKIKDINSLSGIDETLKEITYVNGKIVKIPNWFLIMKGHDLESKIPKVFKKLNTVLINKRSISDYPKRLPGFISKDLLDIFENIQKYNN